MTVEGPHDCIPKWLSNHSVIGTCSSLKLCHKVCGVGVEVAQTVEKVPSDGNGTEWLYLSADETSWVDHSVVAEEHTHWWVAKELLQGWKTITVRETREAVNHGLVVCVS